MTKVQRQSLRWIKFRGNLRRQGTCCQYKNIGSRLSLDGCAPAVDFRQLPVWPVDHHLATTEMDRAAPAVDRDPVTVSERALSNMRTMPIHIHRQFSATNDARLVQLSRDQRPRARCGRRLL